ncbi:2Fe-2S iron-sulfur cluster-binding protein [Lonsdalea quercina]|uniref:2Fe-2S iron-sulfur cluster-binding protein n=1 Tax=Lonsdalea quercina TaxID=71657 RepID=UPI003975AF9F
MSQFYPLQLTRIERDTPDSVVLTLVPQEEHRALFHHMPGQHIILRTFLAGEELRRSYSLCNSPDKPLQVAIKKIEGGRFSHWANTHLKTGKTLEALPPMGSFGLPVEPKGARHYAGFAAGSGITPILSMVQSVLRSEPRSRFTLVYGNRNVATMQLREMLAGLKDLYPSRLSLIYLFSGEEQEIDLFNGRLDTERCAELLKRYLPADTIDYAFICGPDGMMRDVMRALIQHGVVRARIRTESYGSRASTFRPQKKSELFGMVDVKAVIDNAQYQVELSETSENLLDALLQAGVTPRYSCKAGVCAACRCRVLEGEVEMEEPHALAPEEVASGYVLCCRSRPLTSRLSLLFD